MIPIKTLDPTLPVQTSKNAAGNRIATTCSTYPLRIRWQVHSFASRPTVVIWSYSNLEDGNVSTMTSYIQGG